MVIRIVFFPTVVDYTTAEHMFTSGTDVDIVANGVHRNNAFRFAIFRAEHHACGNSVARFTNINRPLVDINLTGGDLRTAKHAFH